MSNDQRGSVIVATVSNFSMKEHKQYIQLHTALDLN